MVSVLETVAEFVPWTKGEGVVGTTAGESIEALLTAPVNTIVSALLPEISVSIVLSVAELALLPRVRVNGTEADSWQQMDQGWAVCPFTWRTRAIARTDGIRPSREEFVRDVWGGDPCSRRSDPIEPAGI